MEDKVLKTSFSSKSADAAVSPDFMLSEGQSGYGVGNGFESTQEIAPDLMGAIADRLGFGGGPDTAPDKAPQQPETVSQYATALQETHPEIARDMADLAKQLQGGVSGFTNEVKLDNSKVAPNVQEARGDAQSNMQHGAEAKAAIYAQADKIQEKIDGGAAAKDMGAGQKGSFTAKAIGVGAQLAGFAVGGPALNAALIGVQAVQKLSSANAEINGAGSFNHLATSARKSPDISGKRTRRDFETGYRSSPSQAEQQVQAAQTNTGASGVLPGKNSVDMGRVQLAENSLGDIKVRNIVENDPVMQQLENLNNSSKESWDHLERRREDPSGLSVSEAVSMGGAVKDQAVDAIKQNPFEPRALNGALV